MHVQRDLLLTENALDWIQRYEADKNCTVPLFCCRTFYWNFDQLTEIIVFSRRSQSRYTFFQVCFSTAMNQLKFYRKFVSKSGKQTLHPVQLGPERTTLSRGRCHRRT